MVTHKVATLFLSWTLSASLEGRLIWDTFHLIFLQSLKPWVNVPSLFILFNTFFFTSILLSSVCPWSVCLLTSEYFVMFSAYVFITNMVAKISQQTDWLVPRSMRTKSSNSEHLLITDKFFKTRRCPLFRGFTLTFDCLITNTNGHITSFCLSAFLLCQAKYINTLLC